MPQQQINTTYHEGRPIIRQCGDTIGILCPYGHVYSSMPAKDWAGSWLEVKASDTNWTVKCDGALPERHPKAVR